MARRQTAGYGRRGSAWSQTHGDLAASLLAPAPTRVAPALLSFATALAVSDAASAFAPAASFRLKWPNDVLVDGAKLSGILIEFIAPPSAPPPAAPASDRAGLVVIGVGVNIVSHPEGLERPCARLADCVAGEPAPRPEEFLARLDAALARRMRSLYEVGFAPTREAWLARAHDPGGVLHVRRAGKADVTGRFSGIDTDGALILADVDGRDGEMLRVAAGEAFPGAPASANAIRAGEGPPRS